MFRVIGLRESKSCFIIRIALSMFPFSFMKVSTPLIFSFTASSVPPNDVRC